jgi:hypothetical protein
MLIIEYVFVMLAACAREGEFMDSEVVGETDKGKIKLPSLRESYSHDSWQKTLSTFDPTLAAFSGPMSGLPNPSNKMPILYALFHKFWTLYILRKVCAETTRYASEINPQSKCTLKKLRDGET